jgi:D-alanyl-D-alanine dipeptidase/quercetin dioxygenase-like cupin family protein
MTNRRPHRFLAAGALLAVLGASAWAAPPSPVVRTVLEAGESLRYPADRPARLTSRTLDFAPGASTGWQRHDVPVFAYLLAGALEFEYADGRRLLRRAGDAALEPLAIPAIVANPGREPARLLLVFMGTEAGATATAVPAPTQPPASPQATAQPDLVDLAEFDPRLKFDIRYATTNNFMKLKMYATSRALLQRPAAAALQRAHERLRAQGYGLLVFDAYRPWQVTRMMWDGFPLDRHYLADPLQGSRHNRGAAVDLTLFDLNTGAEVTMPSPFDDFTERAHPDYAGGTPEQRAARGRLRAAMEAEGFRVYPNEWWHYDYQGWEAYPVLNLPLER